MRPHNWKSDSPAARQEAQAPRVLLLDDNPFAVERIGRVLKDAGYCPVRPAGDEKALIAEVDAIVCDVKRLGWTAAALADADRQDGPVLIGLVPDHWQSSKYLPGRPGVMGYVTKSDVAGLLEILKAGNFRTAAA